ncbi:hypothetical protein A3C86_00045 [Candidatus Kaiserbacteria bacterium RIFCSPHIGHO2_02_FULL_49_16]|uniref:Addiction module toxin RelE n=1 Tax=Candidatus Kaiserbacteria bacterium RIFCSPHIGHO2_02_FULL_49_16 TaxID=1798490 RepID=A0A1F6DHR6_9BACT|nr:MAG: hypothetical protein A3C86_00045 [Candidatus Kaiserbacteria bacterium RIFCSPHIGHO2_02_FULL_49_16]
MIRFLYHEGAEKEIVAQERRFRHLREALKIFERLCEKQFDPTEPQQVIAPAKLHRITQNDLWTMWKIELVIPKSGLRPNQFPRMWFVVKGDIIAVLCLGSHADNYEDIERNRAALERLSDII